MKVFLIDDCDYVAAVTAEDAMAWYRSEIYDGAEECDEVSLDLECNEAEEGEPPIITTFQAMIERDLQDPKISWPHILGTDPYYA